MNLLNNLFDANDMELSKINKRYFKIMIIILVIMLILFCIKKDSYYNNNFTIIDEKMILLVEKEYINKIKKTNTIVINDIETKYSIDNITLEKNIYLLNVSLEISINNINDGVYKIKLGKESLFDYILRVIKK